MVLDCLAPGPKDFPYIAQDGGLICISGFWKIVPNIYGFKGKLLHPQVSNTGRVWFGQNINTPLPNSLLPGTWYWVAGRVVNPPGM
jgi:hypothetical protein